jgi:XTP/dITP diphosphohydrolase
VTRTLVIASQNAGKLHEFREALRPLGFSLLAAAEAGVTSFLPEEGQTYQENALIKAAHVAVKSKLPSLGDDSGLEVEALGGAPGPYSARFGGRLSPGERIAHLLAKLRGVPDEQRQARFVCVLALATPSGHVFTFEGACEGRILQGPRGEGGFGYDPVFYSPELGKSFAEATRKEKARVSHRGRALAALVAWLQCDEAAEALRERDPPKETI